MKEKTTIQINPKVTLRLSADFKPTPLSGRDEWIEALRSGDYAQCTGRLHKSTGYCCLGVKAHLRNEELGCTTLTLQYHKDSEVLFGDGALPLGSYVLLQTDLPPVTCKTLAGLNDSRLANFSEIATVIEHCFTHLSD